MSRVLNFRLIFFIFLAFAFGIAFANYIFNLNIVICVLVALAFAGLFLATLKFKHYTFFICLVLAFILGLGAFLLDSNNFKGNEYNGDNVYISGRISTKLTAYERQAFLVLEDVRINGEKDRDIKLTIYGNVSSLKTGDYLNFDADVYNEELFPNGNFNYYAYFNGAPYFAETTLDEVEIIEGGLTFTEQLKFHLEDVLNDFMSPNGALLGYSIVFGDRTDLPEAVEESFTLSGIAHLLAISGINITFLVAVFYWVFKRLKLSKLLQFILISIILFIYAYLCDFTASVVRAGLMSLIFLASGVFGGRYDLLNSVGLAGLIILIISPMMVFDIGLHLSFVCALAIALLFKPFSKFLAKLKIPKYFCEAIAIDVVTSLAVFPILINNFGSVSMLSLFANLICIPIFALGYILLFMFMILVAILPFLSPLLMLPDVCLRFVILVADFFASMEFARLTMEQFNFITIVVYYAILFIFSRYVIWENAKKIVASLLCVMVGFSLFAGLAHPLTPKDFTYTQLASQEMSSVITTKDGSVLVVAKARGLDYTTDYLRSKRFSSVKTLFLLDTSFSTNKKEYASQFILDFGVKNIVVFSDIKDLSGDFLGIETKKKNIETFVLLDEKLEVENACFESVSINSITKGLVVNIENKNFFLATHWLGEKQQNQMKEILSSYGKFDVLFTEKENHNYMDVVSADKIITQYKITDENKKYKTSTLYSSGNFTTVF